MTAASALRKTNLAQLLRGRAEGIFVAPFEQGEIGAELRNYSQEGWVTACAHSALAPST